MPPPSFSSRQKVLRPPWQTIAHSDSSVRWCMVDLGRCSPAVGGGGAVGGNTLELLRCISRVHIRHDGIDHDVLALLHAAAPQIDAEHLAERHHLAPFSQPRLWRPRHIVRRQRIAIKVVLSDQVMKIAGRMPSTGHAIDVLCS